MESKIANWKETRINIKRRERRERRKERRGKRDQREGNGGTDGRGNGKVGG